MNILFCSVGRRCELLKNVRKTMGTEGKIVATDISLTAPAIYLADKHYIVPRIIIFRPFWIFVRKKKFTQLQH